MYGSLLEVPYAAPGDVLVESWIHVEIDRDTDRDDLRQVTTDLRRILSDVRETVEDRQKMRATPRRPPGRPLLSGLGLGPAVVNDAFTDQVPAGAGMASRHAVPRRPVERELPQTWPLWHIRSTATGSLRQRLHIDIAAQGLAMPPGVIRRNFD